MIYKRTKKHNVKTKKSISKKFFKKKYTLKLRKKGG